MLSLNYWRMEIGNTRYRDAMHGSEGLVGFKKGMDQAKIDAMKIYW